MRLIAAVLVLVAAIGVAVPAGAGECRRGEAASDYRGWEFVANNARRTADAYATRRNPKAVFATARVSAAYQVAGEHQGRYLVMLVHEGRGGISHAVLLPNFAFCGDPGGLDDERRDLFTVLGAKLDGRHF